MRKATRCYNTCFTLHAPSGEVLLAADLVDYDKFQNHFLLTAAALGPQLLRTYDFGTDADGKVKQLTFDEIRAFFFDLLSGKIEAQEMTGTFNISDFTR